MSRLCVKVQLSLMTNQPNRMMLIYDKDRTVQGEFPVTDEVLESMNGKNKAFFYARIDKKGCAVLGERAPWQDW